MKQVQNRYFRQRQQIPCLFVETMTMVDRLEFCRLMNCKGLRCATVNANLCKPARRDTSRLAASRACDLPKILACPERDGRCAGDFPAISSWTYMTRKKRASHCEKTMPLKTCDCASRIRAKCPPAIRTYGKLARTARGRYSGTFAAGDGSRHRSPRWTSLHR